jgi:hypothetical protein
VAGDAQRDRAPRQTGGNHVQPRHGTRWRSIFPGPVRSRCPIAYRVCLTSMNRLQSACSAGRCKNWVKGQEPLQPRLRFSHSSTPRPSVSKPLGVLKSASNPAR